HRAPSETIAEIANHRRAEELRDRIHEIQPTAVARRLAQARAAELHDQLRQHRHDDAEADRIDQDRDEDEENSAAIRHGRSMARASRRAIVNFRNRLVRSVRPAIRAVARAGVVVVAAAVTAAALITVLARAGIRRRTATDFARRRTAANLVRPGRARLRMAALDARLRRLAARLRSHDRRLAALDLPRLGLTGFACAGLLADFAAAVVALECVALIEALARAPNHFVAAALIRSALDGRAALQRLHRRTFHVIARAPLGFTAHALHAFRLAALDRLGIT